jgi:hypothetical protein
MSSGDQFGRTLVKIRNLLRPLLAPWTKGNVTNAVSQYKDFGTAEKPVAPALQTPGGVTAERVASSGNDH